MAIQGISPHIPKVNKKPQKFSVNAMAPLEIKSKNSWERFENNLKKAKEKEVDAISVDVWWGKVEKEKDNKFDWSYYDKVFELIAKNGMKIVPIFSFHKCGGNVGDDVNIPIPEWSWDYLAKTLGKDYKGDETKKELQYKNESGEYIDDVVPVWYDDRMSIQYAEFFKAFKDRYQEKYSDKISEINLSMGPAGELRFPSYKPVTNEKRDFEFPQRGGFVGYNKGGIDAFRTYAEIKYDLDEEKIATRWNIPQKYFKFEKIRPPSKFDKNERKQADEFVSSKCYINTTYGKDFISWYNYSLVKHLRTMLNLADEVFKTGPFNKTDIGVKLPGIHWQIGYKPIGSSDEKLENKRIAEITTGLIQTSTDFNSEKTDFGYKRILDEMKRHKEKWSNQRDLIFHFTSLEKNNQACEGSLGHIASRAKDLVHVMLNGAKKREITIKGENALSCGINSDNNSGWNNIKEASQSGYDGMTFLRVNDIVGNYNKSFENFISWKKETYN